MKNSIIYLFIALLSIAGCRQQGKETTDVTDPVNRPLVGYARLFKIKEGEGYTSVNVLNPWDTTKYLHRYILVRRDREMPENLPDGTLIRTPLDKVVAYSSVHCGIMEALGLDKELVGVCESRYVDLDFVKDGLKNGTIFDLGEAASPNVERIMDISPDAIIASPLGNKGYGRIDKIGIPLIEAVDYMEVTPLGRAEWIRFYALFFCKEQVADSLFKSTVDNYEGVRQIVRNIKNKPTVLSETRTGSVWYIPGGKSYMANLFADAGADYLWKDLQSLGTVPLPFESVLEKGQNADVWVMKYNKPQDMSYKDLANEYSGYENFRAFKNRAIFAANTSEVSYYEELPIHPDYVLKDLVWVFHPELLKGYQPRYFKKMVDK